MPDLIPPTAPGPRVPVLPAGRTEARVRTELDRSIRDWGIPSNLFRTMAWLPGLTLTEVEYANSFIFDAPRYAPSPRPPGDPAGESVLFPQGGFVDRVTKELVINLVSLLNRSRYSLTHHSFIGYDVLRAQLPHADPAHRAARAEEMLLRLVDSTGRPDWEDRTFTWEGTTEPLYTVLQQHCLRLAEAIQRDPHSVTDEQFAALREVLRGVAAENIVKGPLAELPGTGTEAYLEAWVNAMTVELTWCIVHFDGLLNSWFTVLRVMDETGAEDALVWEARRKEFVRFYTVRAGGSYSLGCHDEWNILVRLNRARAAHPAYGPAELIAAYYGGRARSMGESETETSPGYEVTASGTA